MQISSEVPAYTVVKRQIQVTIDLSVLLSIISKNVEINNSLLKQKMLHIFLIINIGLGQASSPLIFWLS